MNFVKKIAFIFLAYGLQACQPNTIAQKAEYEKDFVCKALISGFLKASHLSEFDFYTKQDLATGTIFHYRVSADHATKLSIPNKQMLDFECARFKEHSYHVSLMGQTHQAKTLVMKLHLQNKNSIEKLTSKVHTR